MMRSPSTRSSPRSGRAPSGERPAGPGPTRVRLRPSPALPGPARPTPPSGLLSGPGRLSPAARLPQARVPLAWVSFPQSPLWLQGTSLAPEHSFSHPWALLCPGLWQSRVYSGNGWGRDQQLSPKGATLPKILVGLWELWGLGWLSQS